MLNRKCPNCSSMANHPEEPISILQVRDLPTESEEKESAAHRNHSCKTIISNGNVTHAIMIKKAPPKPVPRPDVKLMSFEELEQFLSSNGVDLEKVLLHAEGKMTWEIRRQLADFSAHDSSLTTQLKRYNCTLKDMKQDIRQATRSRILNKLTQLTQDRLESRGNTDAAKKDFVFDFVDWLIKQIVKITIMNWMEYNFFSIQSKISTGIAYLRPKGDTRLFDELPMEVFRLYRNACNQPIGKDILGKLPILFFGNLPGYLQSDIRVMTLSRMPPKNEFADGVERFCESTTNYSTMIHRPMENTIYLTQCCKYFDNNPNMEYFQRFSDVMSRWNASYWYTEVPENALSQDSAPDDAAAKNQAMPRRNIAIHFNFNSPIALERTWESLTQEEQREISFEARFRDIFNTLAPHIIISDFDLNATWLAPLDSNRPTVE